MIPETMYAQTLEEKYQPVRRPTNATVDYQLEPVKKIRVQSTDCQKEIIEHLLEKYQPLLAVKNVSQIEKVFDCGTKHILDTIQEKVPLLMLEDKNFTTNEDYELQIRPNPAIGITNFYIRTDNLQERLFISIYNQNGKLVMNFLAPANCIITKDMVGLSSGNYNVCIQDDNKNILCKKLMILK